MLNPHTILGVPADASPADIKAAYRRLASRLHPDRNPGHQQAEDQLKDVNRAYRMLCEQERECAGQAKAPNHFFSFVERVAEMFRPPEQIDIPLSFEEALQGVTKQAQLKRQVPCSRCAGRDPKAKGQCVACRGEGRQAVEDCVVFQFLAGAGEGASVLIKSAAGYPMLGVARVASHSLWERDGVDVSITVPLAIEELWAGNTISVLTPYQKLGFVLPKGFCLNTPVRLAGQGVWCAEGGPRGDLWVTFAPELPDAQGRSVRKEAYLELEKAWVPISIPG